MCAALPLYWRIVGRTTRRQLVFGVYQFFVVCLVVYAALGLFADGAVRIVERKALTWRRTLEG